MTSKQARYLVSTLTPLAKEKLLEDIQFKQYIHGELFSKEIVDYRLYLFITAELKGENPSSIDPLPVRHRVERFPTRYLLPGQTMEALV